MASNTRKITSNSSLVTRGSVTGRRSITLRTDKTSSPVKSSKAQIQSDVKKESPSSEKKSYSLRNSKQASPETKNFRQSSYHSLEQTRLRERTTNANKGPIKSEIVYISDNSDDSGEIEFNPEAIKIKSEINRENDVVVLSSDDETLLESIEKIVSEESSAMIVEETRKSQVDPGFVKTDTESHLTVESSKGILLQANDTNSAEEKLKLEETVVSPEASFVSDKMDSSVVSTNEISSSEEPKSDPIELTCPESNHDEHSSVPEIKFEIVPNFSGSEHKAGNDQESTDNAKVTEAVSKDSLQKEQQNQSVRCKVYDPSADDAMPDRPVSSNSRSTTSVSSHAQHDNDFYSPGSTDLSMSEDSRGSFRESGNEKSTSGRKSRGRLKSQLTFRSMRRNKRSGTNVSSSRSPSEDGSVEPPQTRSKRLPNRTGIVWEIGQRLEAVDHNECRYPAKIVEVDRDACEVLIHFEGWSVRFDEWVPMDSPKLRPPSISKTEKEKQPPKHQFKANEKIFARWNDGKLYEATVTQVLSEGHYAVLFYDGFTKKLPVSAMRKLNDKTIRDKKLKMRVLPKQEEHRRHPFKRTKMSTEENPSPGHPTTSVASNIVASKQFVVQADHNQFKCTYGDCNKEFRKETLLQSHIKHYHLSGRSCPTSPRKIKSRTKSQTLQHQEIPESATSTAKLTGDTEGADIAEKFVPLQDPPESEKPQLVVPVPENSTVAGMESEINRPPTETPSEAVSKPQENPGGDETRQDPQPPPKPEVKMEGPPVKVVKAPLRKEVYPVTKMETRHAKPCLFRDDSIYTGYMSYRSLYAKSSKGARKSTDTDSTKKGRSGKNEDEKNGGETRRRKRRVFKKVNSRKHKTDCPDIDDEIAEIKKRRVDRVSESSVKTDDTTRESVDYDDDETVSDQQEVYDDEVVRCICENEEENGLMFQCEDCKTWQHAACFNIENEEDVPDTYFCYICTKAKGAATDVLQTETDAWFTDGVLSTFNFFKDDAATTSRPNAILATHELVNSTNKVLFILRSLQQKIQIAGRDSHPDLKHWSKPWKQTAKHSEMVVPQASQTLSLPSQSTAESQEVLVFDHAYFSHSDGAIGFQEEVVTEISETPDDNIQFPLPASNNMILPEVSTSKPAPPVQEPKEKIQPKRRTGGREAGRGRGGRWREAAAPAEEVADTNTCKNNLIHHIHDVQDNVEHGLDLIENQLNLLEAEMNSPGGSGNDEVTNVLKSLKNLSKDLDVVQRFTFL